MNLGVKVGLVTFGISVAMLLGITSIVLLLGAMEVSEAAKTVGTGIGAIFATSLIGAVVVDWLDR